MAEAISSNTTVVDFEAMASAIASYQEKVKHIQAIIQSLEGIATALGVANVFSGGAASTFLTAVASTISAMNEAMNALNAIIQGLQGKLDTYQAADKAAASIASAVKIEAPVWSDV